jgi:hypothetical protein
LCAGHVPEEYTRAKNPPFLSDGKAEHSHIVETGELSLTWGKETGSLNAEDIMIRALLMLLIMGIIVWLGLHQCTDASRSTLVIKPSASFPKEKNALLGQSVARILPHCPGFQKLGAVLEFTDLTEGEDAVTLHFTAPDSPDIPAEWGARGQQCAVRVEKHALILGAGAACQALCLGEPGVEGRDVRKTLGGKEQ